MMDHTGKSLVERGLLMKDLVVIGITKRSLIGRGDTKRSPSMMSLVTATVTVKWKI
jgi:hypothetical protein